MSISKYGQFDSWEIKSESVALKTADKSFFKYHSTGIPKETKWFWNIERLQRHERQDLELIYQDHSYRAYISLDSALNRARLFWYSDLSQILHDMYWSSFCNGELLVFSFSRIGTNTYCLAFGSITEDDTISESQDVFEVFEPTTEGVKKVYYTTHYERDPRNRAACIRIHGTKCAACSFDFGAIYGDWGQGYIEVHHRKPLFSLDEPVLINPTTDLVPVCSNCHRMIHRTRNRILSIDELKALIFKNT